MGFRFQRRIKIAPGISVNLSKSGVSTSIGPRGAKVTVGHGKVRTTVGLPGTGLSYTDTKSVDTRNASSSSDSAETKNLLIGIGFIAALIFVAWVISLF